MKSILVFVGGFFLSLFLLGAVAYYFLFLSPTKTIAPDSVAPMGKEVRLRDGEVVFTATIVVPEPLKKFVKSGEGGFTIRFFDANWEPLSIATNMPAPTFPMQLKFSVPKAALAASSEGVPFVTFIINYCPNYEPGECFVKPYSALVWGQTHITTATLAQKTKNLSQPIDLGAVYFTRNVPEPRECKDLKVSLAGKITPTPDFQKKLAGQKLALVITPRLPTRKYDPPVSPAEVDGKTFLTQFVDFSQGPVSFSVPVRSLPDEFFVLHVVQCKPEEELKACAAGLFPYNTFGTPGARAKFRVVTKDLSYPRCGQENFEGFVHSSLAVEPPLPLNPPKPQKPVSPAEYLEGAFL